MLVLQVAMLAIYLGTTPDSPKGHEPTDWRDSVNCGPNCVYLVLRLEGYEVTYRQIRDALKLGPLGCTIADMQTTLAKFGLNSSPVRCQLDELEPHLPAIVHLEADTSDLGHFVTVLGCDSKSVFVVETLNAQVVPVDRNEFLRQWSGAALVPKRRSTWPWRPAIVGVLGLVIVALSLAERPAKPIRSQK